ncbi:MAG TPA: VOC family protein [Chloroflexia bacterium]|nr:VOC family protein [Chloroflexia bacterium]
MGLAVQVVMDCENPDKLAHFWAAVLNYQLEPPPPGFNSWPEFLKANNYPESEWDSASAIVDPDGKGPRLFFQKVPERKTLKNRMHLDVNVTGGLRVPLEERRQKVNEAAERVEKLGATKVKAFEEYGGYWITMTDPEGNEFDLH